MLLEEKVPGCISSMLIEQLSKVPPLMESDELMVMKLVCTLSEGGISI